MVTRRFTITLPDRIAEQVLKEAEEAHRPVSGIIAEALKYRDQERKRQEMIQGAREAAAINKEIAEEFWPIAGETLLDD